MASIRKMQWKAMWWKDTNNDDSYQIADKNCYKIAECGAMHLQSSYFGSRISERCRLNTSCG